MDKLLNSLYSYDNFGIYLIIAIVILVIIFFVILFFGKKDKKNRELEETIKLQKLDSDLFKKDELKEEVVTNLMNNEEVTPIKNMEVEEVIPEPVTIEPILPPENIVIPEPILQKEEEPKLIIDENPVLNETPMESTIVPEFNIDDIAARAEAISLGEQKEINNVVEPQEIEREKEEIKRVTTIEEDKMEKKNQPVFSSVYVPEVAQEKEEVIESNMDEEFELPSLKTEEPKVEEIHEEPISQQQEEPEVIPEVKEEPVLNTIDLDSITGESYNLNK